jgi:hypothetical protein
MVLSAKKLVDEQLDPEEVLRGTLVSELVAEQAEEGACCGRMADYFRKEPEQSSSFQINDAIVYDGSLSLRPSATAAGR